MSDNPKFLHPGRLVPGHEECLKLFGGDLKSGFERCLHGKKNDSAHYTCCGGSKSSKGCINVKDKHIGIGILGYGMRIEALVSKLLLLYEDYVEVVAVMDYQPGSRDKAGEMKQYGIISEKCVIVDNIDDVLSHPNVDWVFIGSRNSEHFDMIMAACAKGKSIFCEKPICCTEEQARKLRETVPPKNFITGFTLRYSPFYRHFLALTSKIGDIISIDQKELLAPDHGAFIMRDWRRFESESGGHLLEKCCHDLDILLSVVQSKPERVWSEGSLSFFLPERKKDIPKDMFDPVYMNWTHYGKEDPFESEKDIMDDQHVQIAFENGIRVAFHSCSHSFLPERSFKVYGTKGTIYMDVISGQMTACFDFNARYERTFHTGGMHGRGDEFLVEYIFRTMMETHSREKKIEYVNDMQQSLGAVELALMVDRACLKHIPKIPNRSEKEEE
eukprot:TRINITY_DN10292_c0_g1_i2.p1 TRINITY_DN10292_c0_g1~~TRINITY_DN10292_c0_g1_i2.p1  ORF type:complete len:444 (-),score=101.70 TRINITY_DN10292_c0_g1_i2:619-1950(-)